MRLLTLLFHDVYEADPSESGFSEPGAERYKLTRPAFEAQLGGLHRARGDRPLLATELPPLSPVGAPFAVTVDDGGVSYYTIVADRLEALGWRGHCFVTTGMIGRPGFLDGARIRELHRRGHLIGSHSVSHPARFSAQSREQMVSEWAESRARLTDLLGQDVTVGSVPGGYFSRRVAEAAREAGLRVLFTSEPETRVAPVAGCMVAGRFTMRPGRRPDFARDLARLRRSTLLREFTVWNGKKLIKACLGRAYPRLAGATASLGRSAAGFGR
jgi:peptidoglycan/xylan/chitin deacetylase (PgdA/CDA1 family)